MGTKYSTQSASGYNASPPPDDGSTVAANKITWAKIKSALADSIKTLADAINSALVNAFDYGASTTSIAYTTVAGDHEKLIEASGTFTISLGDAVTMAAGYRAGVCNKGTGLITVGVITATDKINGNTNGTVKLLPGVTVWFLVNQAANGYDIDKAANQAPLALASVAGTNTITAACDAIITAIAANQRFLFTPANTNTGATTLNITPAGGSALTAKNVFFRGAACTGGELRISVPVEVVYDGTQFNILGAASFLPGMNLIAIGTASNSAVIDFTQINSTYDVYVVDIVAAVPATDAAGLTLRMSIDVGSTYKAGATDYAYATTALNVGAAADNAASTGATFILLPGATGTSNTATNGGVDARVILYNLNSSSQKKHVTCVGSHIAGAAGVNGTTSFAGSGSTSLAALLTSPVNAIRFIEGAGNITSGTFYLYGMRKA